MGEDYTITVLATDGLSERGIGVEAPAAAVADAVDRAGRTDEPVRPLEAARGTVETALAAQRAQGAGDNVASAVAWLDT